MHLVSGRIPVSGGGYLYYDETVSTVPGPKETVVLLHGHSLDRRMWDEQLPALADRYHVVRIDLRGYGLSSDQEEEQPFLHAEDVITVLDSLRLDQVNVVG
ncbi:MAG: alpha/beta hydrolase [Bacteroidales bacterium]|nr:alpha/beta hydrolase [Bacteroidales bacterium]